MQCVSREHPVTFSSSNSFMYFPRCTWFAFPVICSIPGLPVSRPGRQWLWTDGCVLVCSSGRSISAAAVPRVPWTRQSLTHEAGGCLRGCCSVQTLAFTPTSDSSFSWEVTEVTILLRALL